MDNEQKDTALIQLQADLAELRLKFLQSQVEKTGKGQKKMERFKRC